MTVRGKDLSPEQYAWLQQKLAGFERSPEQWISCLQTVSPATHVLALYVAETIASPTTTSVGVAIGYAVNAITERPWQVMASS